MTTPTDKNTVHAIITLSASCVTLLAVLDPQRLAELQKLAREQQHERVQRN